MFIARQPIFNKSMKVYGYELLYRDNFNANYFDNSSDEKSTATVLSGLFELGIDEISNNKQSFINFSYDFIMSDLIELIDPKNLIIEILENTVIDNELLNRLLYLKSKGYKIALDDFVNSYESLDLVSIADIIKYDIIKTPLGSIKREVKHFIDDEKILVAEKVETKDEYNDAKEMGFHLFQGFFFEKPNIVAKAINTKSPKCNYIEVMNEIKKSDPSFNKLTNIIKRDVNLSHRLLLSRGTDNLNNNDFIDNIKNALINMGINQIRRWINILILRDLATNKPNELIRLSLLRANFGELLAKNSKFKTRSNEIYGMFLFSTLDVLLDQSMEEALKNIPISEDVKKALILKEGDLNYILQLVYLYEKGNWESVNFLSNKLNIDQTQISKYYLNSIIYCNDIVISSYNKM